MKRQNFGNLSALASIILALVVGSAPQTGWAQTTSMVVTEPAVAGQPGNVGLGTDNPARQLHIQGRNALFRLDRDVNGAGFFLVRTAENNFASVLKTFGVTVRTLVAGGGEFVINDLGSAVDGPGSRRLTITNEGNVVLTGTLTQSSSIRYKSEVETIPDADRALSQLRGVKFTRKANGKEDLGLVAEEVAKIYPQLVEKDAETGQVESVNYSAMVAVLVEGYKAQEKKLAVQRQELEGLRARMAAIESMVASQATSKITAFKP